MENSFQIKLQCNITDPHAVHSLLSLMLEKMKALHAIKGTVQQMELKLYDDATSLDEGGEADKIALFRMSNNDEQVVEYSRSKRWDDALLNTVEKIHVRLQRLNPWEKIA